MTADAKATLADFVALRDRLRAEGKMTSDLEAQAERAFHLLNSNATARKGFERTAGLEAAEEELQKLHAMLTGKLVTFPRRD